jgi:hypothetical protein
MIRQQHASKGMLATVAVRSCTCMPPQDAQQLQSHEQAALLTAHTRLTGGRYTPGLAHCCACIIAAYNLYNTRNDGLDPVSINSWLHHIM